MDVEGSGRGIF